MRHGGSVRPYRGSIGAVNRDDGACQRVAVKSDCPLQYRQLFIFILAIAIGLALLRIWRLVGTPVRAIFVQALAPRTIVRHEHE